MIVDDEPASLQRLKRLIEAYDSIKVSGHFTDGHELLQALNQTEIDVVFLDIEMPEISGMELAKVINKTHPEIDVVFVTAYEEYALHAFDVEAIDYLLKPIRKEQLERCISRLEKRKGNSTSSSRENEKKGKVHCFQKFLIFGAQGEYVKFRNSKSEELLAFLIHHRGEPVSKDEIIEMLWKGRDYERALATLYSTMYQLRKDMEPHGLDELIGKSKSGGGYYSFRISEVECDYLEFEKKLPAAIKDIETTFAIIDLYKGSYLEKNDYLWAQEESRRFENEFIKVVENLSQMQVEEQKYQAAIETMQKLCNLRPYEERYHEKIIDLYTKNNELSRAKEYKVTIEEMYKSDLGISIELKIRGKFIW